MRLLSSSFLYFQSFLRHFTTKTTTNLLPSLSKIPPKYRSQALEEAREVLTDYLHTTRALPFPFAEQISKHSIYSLSELVSKVYISSTTFRKSFLKFLRYNPINEFGFFYESIGIDYVHVNHYLKPKVHFFHDDFNVFDVACALAGFGFPWNKLGVLYVREVSIFEKKPAFLGSKFNGLLGLGFSAEQAAAVCLAFPCLLKGDEDGLSGEFDGLLDDLKRVFDLDNCGVGNVDVWYHVCRRIMVFYDLGFERGMIAESIGNSNSNSNNNSNRVFIDYAEEDLIDMIKFLRKFGVGDGVEVGLLILSNPEIVGLEIDKRVISVSGILRHFGMPKEKVESLSKRYSYVFDRNKISNLPHILRAIELHEWFFNRMNLGEWQLLANYDLSEPNEGEDEKYVQNFVKIKSSRCSGYSLSKLEFLHGIGFGENDFVATKLVVDVHGSASALENRFDLLLSEGIEFSKIVKMISYVPKILNQDVECLKNKLDFLRLEAGHSLEFVENFPAFLMYNLEKRIKPRYRFHVWLDKQGWPTKKFTLSGIIAISKKGFLQQLSHIHPTAPQLWLEQCGEKKTTTSDTKKIV